ILLSGVLGLAEAFTSMLTRHFPTTDHLMWMLDLFRSGLQLLALGLVGEYLGRALMLQSGFPQYVVKKSILKHDRPEH
ncbi:MAG: hypothetical protein H7Y12_07545, partial [Sphingobacteriaceae bacterium]|nr:hypothetical protein [Cytophagaceae bacterium]